MGSMVGGIFTWFIIQYVIDNQIATHLMHSYVLHLLICVLIHMFSALSPADTIGSFGVRNFMLCKKPGLDKAIEQDAAPKMTRKSSGSWKTWFNKSLNLKISSH